MIRARSRVKAKPTQGSVCKFFFSYKKIGLIKKVKKKQEKENGIKLFLGVGELADVCNKFLSKRKTSFVEGKNSKVISGR